MAETYGNATLEDIRDKLISTLNGMVTAMATGYDPTVSYVYDHHNVGYMQFNAVSVGLENAEPDNVAFGSAGVTVQYRCQFTVRVHTAYQGALVDEVKNSRLINSVVNYLSEYKNQAGGYWIQDIDEVTANEEFAESYTVGGQCTVLATKPVTHTQG
uniref:Tail protein n=1 Tax=viral metagenome TaxID=1070528 RepID=A0A6M3JV00_9ZZZZ